MVINVRMNNKFFLHLQHTNTAPWRKGDCNLHVVKIETHEKCCITVPEYTFAKEKDRILQAWGCRGVSKRRGSLCRIEESIGIRTNGFFGVEPGYFWEIGGSGIRRNQKKKAKIVY